MAIEKIVIFHHDMRGAVVTWSEIGEVVRCKDCKHFHENVWGDDVGIGAPYDNIIVAHNGCDFWGGGQYCVTAKDGFCFKGERRDDG